MYIILSLLSLQYAYIVGYKHIVRYGDWPSDCHYPDGQILQTLGKENNFDTDAIALLYESDVCLLLSYSNSIVRNTCSSNTKVNAFFH